jgi:CDP-paratose 2-epimerase
MKALVTGGAGFIGCHVAAGLARLGHDVVVADNLSRVGSITNLRGLVEEPSLAPRIEFRWLDVRDGDACLRLLGECVPDAIVHLAGQVAVTHSMANAAHDFDCNARGTLNVLEAVRIAVPDGHVVFASTNKVYGSLDGARIERRSTRYVLSEYPDGIPETFPADAATPYGCSKLAADAYVRDYGRTFGLRTTVLRMSCIYGTRQHGTTDQGWVSWFVRAGLAGIPITIFGDGLQVRDLLHVDDLVELVCELVTSEAGVGEMFNVGGGSAFSVSVWAEFGALLEDIVGQSVKVRHAEPRPADQAVYISDTRHVTERLSWTPRTPPTEGLAKLAAWTRAGLERRCPVKEMR